jgi:hypothetical protein
MGGGPGGSLTPPYRVNDKFPTKSGFRRVQSCFIDQLARATGRSAHAAGVGGRSGSARAVSCAPPPPRIRRPIGQSCRRENWTGKDSNVGSTALSEESGLWTSHGETSRPHPYWRNHAAACYPRAPSPLGSRHVKYAGGLALAALFVTNCGGTNATNSWNYLVKGPYIQQARLIMNQSKRRQSVNFCVRQIWTWESWEPSRQAARQPGAAALLRPGLPAKSGSEPASSHPAAPAGCLLPFDTTPMRPLLAVPCVLALTTRQASAHGGCTGAECTHEPPDSKVTVLNPSNYHRFINKNPLVLMEFYAPWCGHCQVRPPGHCHCAAGLWYIPSGCVLSVPVPVRACACARAGTAAAAEPRPTLP